MSLLQIYSHQILLTGFKWGAQWALPSLTRTNRGVGEVGQFYRLTLHLSSPPPLPLSWLGPYRGSIWIGKGPPEEGAQGTAAGGWWRLEPRPARRQMGRNTQRRKEESKRRGGAAAAGPGRVPGAGGEAQWIAWSQPRGKKKRGGRQAGGGERGPGAQLPEDRI